MKSLEKRVEDYKLIKSAIKRVDNGYKAVQLNNSGSEIDPISAPGGFSIYSFIERLIDSDNVGHFIVHTFVDKGGMYHADLDYINKSVYHDFDEAMNECYHDIIKYARKFMHLTNGYVLNKGMVAVICDGKVSFAYTTSLANLFSDRRKEEMDYYRRKKMVKMNPYLRSKKPVQKDEAESISIEPKKGVFKKVFNYFSPKKEKYSGASADTG